MTRRRFAAFAVTAVLLAAVITIAGVLVVDIYLHRRYEDLIGLNVWGYRGPTVGRKASDEWRLLVLGESSAFGYGVPWHQAFPAYLQMQLNGDAAQSRRPVSVVNLAYNNEGALSYQYTLRDYEYLNADAVILYSGYNDLSPNTSVFRHNSAIFQLTGYMPLFPIIFNEKARAIRSGGELELSYLNQKTTFRPNLAQRATAAALDAAVAVSRSLDAQFVRRFPEPRTDPTAAGVPCGGYWSHYCTGMHTAVKQALDSGKRVLIATQPYLNDSHVEQQRHLRAFLESKFGNTRRLHFANLGESVIDLKDRALCYDGMHLTAAGNQRVAAALAPHVRALMR